MSETHDPQATAGLAGAALASGDFDGAIAHLRSNYDFYRERANDPSVFDREKFIAGRASRGEFVNETLIAGARQLSESMRAVSRREARISAAEAAFCIALAYSIRGQTTQARDWLTTALELNPDHRSARAKLTELAQ